MTILEKKSVPMADAREIVSNLEEKKELKDYLKRFTKLSKEKSSKLSEEIFKLNNMKIKDEHVIKIVDFLPKTPEELNKIFIDVSLSEEETNTVLEIVKKY